MTQEAEIVVNGETVGYGLDGMLAAYEKMMGGSMPDLLTASFVMERSEGAFIPTGKIPFVYRDDDGEVVHFLLLDPEVYEEMGLGERDLRAEITVTVEPGHTLSGGDAVLGVIEDLDT